jgi:hypothetical protein
MKFFFVEFPKAPIISKSEQLEAYFLALDIIQGLADLENAPKCLPGPEALPGPAVRERTEAEIKAFDDGYTAAVCVLHARGYENAALALVSAAEDLDVRINIDIIDAYVEVSRG